MKILPLFIITLSLVCFDAFAEKIPFVHEKAYVLPSGKTVAVKFQERRCTDATDHCSEADASIWGIDGGKPRFVTETFLVFINGKRFIIPEKFYKDLTNTYQVDVFEQDARIVIELKGGEAAAAYTAGFTLGGMCGFERKVCGEVCKEIWERTIWHNSFAYEAEPGCESGVQ